MLLLVGSVIVVVAESAEGEVVGAASTPIAIVGGDAARGCC